MISLTCPNRMRCELASGSKAIIISMEDKKYTGKEKCKKCGCQLEKVVGSKGF